jgi:hypothetical protein
MANGAQGRKWRERAGSRNSAARGTAVMAVAAGRLGRIAAWYRPAAGGPFALRVQLHEKRGRRLNFRG